VVFGIDDLISGGLSFGTQMASVDATNAANLKLQQNANAFNAQQAQQQMGFQERMSNTSYQRSMADMKAAGLNPMLAIMKGGGASTPSGAAASAAPSPNMQNSVGQGLSSALDTMRLKKELASTDADIATKHATTAVMAAQAKKEESNATMAARNADILEAQTPALKAQAALDQKRAGYDLKAAGYDAIMDRAKTATGTISNAVGAAGGGVGKFINNLFGGGNSSENDRLRRAGRRGIPLP